MGQTHLDGDSLLLFPNKVETFEVRFDDRGSTIGAIMLGHNSDRRLSTATMRIQANSLVEAEEAAYNMTAGFLSYLSYTTDVAVEITGYEIVEESTGTRKAVFGMIGKMKILTQKRITPEGDLLLRRSRCPRNLMRSQ